MVDTGESSLIRPATSRAPAASFTVTAHDPQHARRADTLLDAGEEPVVVETRSLLTDPPRVLSELCRRLGVPFDPAMLAWPPGPKPEDGVWAPYWYDAVHRSTGWAPYSEKQADLLPGVVPAYEQSLPLYDRLLPYRIP